REEDGRADDRRGAARGDPQRAPAADGRRPAVREPRRDLRRARVRIGDPPASRLPGHRRLGAVDRGDRAAHPPRGAAARARGADAVKPRPKVPLWRWVAWYMILGLALVVFYGLFTPVWFGLRSLAWLAEYRARRRR